MPAAPIPFGTCLKDEGGGMIIFAFPAYEPLLDTLQLLPLPAQKGNFEISRFDNGELVARVGMQVRRAHCVVLGSVAPPDEQLLSLALLAHTLKKEGCRRLTVLLPYLGYSRQDKEKPGESLAAAWVGSVLRASGVDEVVTIDVHSARDKQLFSMPLVSLFPAEIFADAIRKCQLTDVTIVAPDNGAMPRCQAVNHALGKAVREIPYFEKKRSEAGIKHTHLIGRVGTRALIIDDILDTGGTLLSACEKLLHAGVSEIHIMVTHGLFTGTDWKRLWSLEVRQIFCTDTIPAMKDILDERRIVVLPIGQLLKEQIALLHDVSVPVS
jgi:ribose-phosphate pyrophosphokinase